MPDRPNPTPERLAEIRERRAHRHGLTRAEAIAALARDLLRGARGRTA